MKKRTKRSVRREVEYGIPAVAKVYEISEYHPVQMSRIWYRAGIEGFLAGCAGQVP